MDPALLARQTLSLLEDRLDKIRLLLHGEAPADGGGDAGPAASTISPVTRRVQKIDQALRRLESESEAIQQLLSLHKSQSTGVTTAGGRWLDDGHDEGVAASVAASVCISQADRYRATASDLRYVQDLSVPESWSSAHMLAQVPRIRQATARADEQRRQVAELRSRSAGIVSRWHAIGVVSVGEAIEDWDGRLMEGEKKVRQTCLRRREGARV